MDFSNLIYARLNFDYPKEVFVHEYDQFILPNSVPIGNHVLGWSNSKSINKLWNMVPESVYEQADVLDEKNNVIKQGYPCWEGTSLIFAYTRDEEERELSRHGSVAFRNTRKGSYSYNFKPKYVNLEIVKFIKNLPITEIIGIRCVSLQPGGMATIHRDSNSYNYGESTAKNNHLWRDGYISITINLSNGGKPLYYCCDDDLNKPMLVDDKIYLFNDFVYHGVPVVESRRRQIRITAKPTPEFENYVDKSSCVLL
jgi:hypothetical protein